MQEGSVGASMWDALLRLLEQTSTAADWPAWLDDFLRGAAGLVGADSALFVAAAGPDSLRIEAAWNLSLSDEALHGDLAHGDGLIARCWKRREVVFDAARDPSHAVWSGTADVASMLASPCMSDEAQAGILVVGWRTARAGVGADERRVLETVSRYLASAKRRHELAARAAEHEASARHARRLYAALSQVNQAIVRSRTTDELLRRACDAAAGFANPSLAWIGWLDEDSGMLRPEVWHGGPAPFVAMLRRNGAAGRPGSVAHRALAESQVQMVSDIMALPEAFPLRKRSIEAGYRSLAIAPIVAPTRRGVLALYAAEANFFSAGDIALVEELAIDIAHGLGAFESTERLRHSEATLRSVFETVQDGLLLIDRHGRIEMANAAVAAMFGREVHDVVGGGIELLMNDGDRAHVPQRFAHNLTRGHRRVAGRTTELVGRRKDGTTFPFALSVGECQTDQGPRFVGAIRDRTKDVALVSRLEHLAFHDVVTGTLNRVGLADAFSRMRAGAGRQGLPARLMVVRIDVDSFGAVNTALGEPHGDRVLATMARRLKRLTDSQDVVARTGGDEFTVLHRLDGSEDAGRYLRALAARVSGRYRVDRQVHHVRFSAGAALLPDHGTEFGVLWRRADVALRSAKRAGGDGFRLFDSDTERVHVLELAMSERVLAALEGGELVLHYQPQVDILTGAVRGVEALVRWQPPDRPLVPPGEFLPYIHDPYTIARLGDWVIAEALEQWRRWGEQGIVVRVGVNVAAEHFLAPNFARRLRQHLSEAGAFGRSALEIEITESAALQVQQAKRVMDACHRLGVPISLDDFGTGYSSIFYLNELPFDALKVDPSFTRQMLATSDGWAIVLSMLLMGTAAHLEVIAEGVETTAHEEALVRLGVRWAQGYTYARPMPAGNLPDWLARWPARLEGRDLSPSLGTGAECLTALHLHTRWVSRLLLWANHPETALDAGEMLNEKRCQFTQWLAERTDARPGLATIAQVHRRAHSAVTSAVRETRDEDLGAALTAQLQAEDQRLLGAILAYRAVADGLRITAAE